MSVNDFSICGNHDGGDCLPFNNTNWPDCPFNEKYIGDSECDDHLKKKNECNFDGIDCCPHDKKTINDGNCDFHMLSTAQFAPNFFCNFDGTDCCNIIDDIDKLLASYGVDCSK